MPIIAAQDLPVAPDDLNSAPVRSVNQDGESHVVATRNIATGQFLITVDGELTTAPCRYSVQVTKHLHVAPPSDLARSDAPDRYVWRFLNHSCNPNAMMLDRDLVAITDIAEGEQVTFDYNSTEYDLAVPFRCRCRHCDGSEIRGYRYLGPAEQRRRAHRSAQYLRDAPDETNA